jgi:hypothetical protein
MFSSIDLAQNSSNFKARNFKAKIIIAIVIIAAFCGALAFLFPINYGDKNPELTSVEDIIEIQEEEVATSIDPKIQTIGNSVLGRKIESYTFGNADSLSSKHLLFVGGIHGGYEWNTVILAYQFIDYFKINPEAIPANTQITIIPSANPDGLYKIVGKEGRFVVADIPAGTDESPGRFNANGIDLNRNFACKWKPESSWRGNVVSAGASAFSEPEALAIKNFVVTKKPDAVAFWHSQGNAVYASECEAGILPATLTAMNTYATASGYAPVESFDAYEISGDAEGWLASIGIPGITVELETHKTIEWERNLAGTKALIKLYSK